MFIYLCQWQVIWNGCWGLSDSAVAESLPTTWVQTAAPSQKGKKKNRKKWNEFTVVISGKSTVKEKKNRSNQKHSAGEDSSVCLLREWEFNYFCQVTVRHKSELWSCLKSVWAGQVFRFMYRGNGVDPQRETAASRLCSQTSEMEILMAQRREFFADFLYKKALFLRQFFSALLLWRLICEDMCPIEAIEHGWASLWCWHVVT